MSPVWMVFIVVAGIALLGAYLAVRLSRPAGHDGPTGRDESSRDL